MSKLTQQEQILDLNNTVRCSLGASSIHGIGVFALRDIEWGEKCYCKPNMIPKFYKIPFGSLNKLLPEIRELVLARWASVVNGSIFQSPNDDQSLLMFCNHSSNPNYDAVSDTTLRDIHKGEEILEDYTVMKNWQLAYPNLKTWKSEKENHEQSISEKKLLKENILNLFQYISEKLNRR